MVMLLLLSRKLAVVLTAIAVGVVYVWAQSQIGGFSIFAVKFKNCIMLFSDGDTAELVVAKSTTNFTSSDDWQLNYFARADCWEQLPSLGLISNAGNPLQEFHFGQTQPGSPIYINAPKAMTAAAGWNAELPYAFIFGLLAIQPAVFLLFRRRCKPGHCGKCGFDLRASRERCPECGTVIPTKTGRRSLDPTLDDDAVRRWRRRWWVWWSIIVLGVNAAGAALWVFVLEPMFVFIKWPIAAQYLLAAPMLCRFTNVYSMGGAMTCVSVVMIILNCITWGYCLTWLQHRFVRQPISTVPA